MTRSKETPRGHDEPPALRPTFGPDPRTTPSETRPPAPPRGGSKPGSPRGTPRTSAVVVVGRGELPEHVFRRLLAAYLTGAREFVIRERPGLRPSTRDVVRTFCRRTRQPEIVSDEGSLVRLQDLAFQNPISFDQRIARMGRLVVDFHREAVDSWTRLPFGEDGAWERRDDEVDREAWYLQRLVAVRLTSGSPGVDLLGHLTIGRSLERIADHAVVLGEAGRRLIDLSQGSAPMISLRQFHAQAMEHLEGVLSARDDRLANDLLDMGEALLTSGHTLADRLLPAVNGASMPPATAAAVARILESIGRTIAYAQDIGQVALDQALPAESDDLARPGPRRMLTSVA